MLGITDFSLFSEPSPVEVIEDALVEILSADEEIHQFFHAIKRLPDLFAEPDRPLPKLFVTGLQQSMELEPGGEAEVQMRFGLGIVYDESRDLVEPGERTIRACVHRIWQTLIANPNLEGTSAGDRAYGSGGALVHRFDGLLPLQFDQIAIESDEDGSPTSTSFLQLAALYMMNVDATTGNPIIA